LSSFTVAVFSDARVIQNPLALQFVGLIKMHVGVFVWPASQLPKARPIQTTLVYRCPLPTSSKSG